LEVVGKNPNAAAPFFQFGIDGIRIEKPAPLAGGETVDRPIPKDPDAEPITSESDAKRASTDGG
jgi:hypothetical protein